MGLFEDLNTGKYNLILIIVLFVLAFYQFFAKSMKEPMVQEHMADVSDAQIADAVKKYYLSDEFINNISLVSAKIKSDGLSIPILKLGSWTIREADHGHLIFIKDGTKYDPNLFNIPENTGFLAMAGDGNFWSNRSTSRGWLPDNISNSSNKLSNDLSNGINGLNGLSNELSKLSNDLSNLLPRGTIIAWNKVNAPTGWVLCDGTNGTPDLRGRFILGANDLRTGGNNSRSNRSLDQVGGTETIANTMTTNGVQFAPPILNSTKVPTNTGYNIMPPFYVLTYIMKT